MNKKQNMHEEILGAFRDAQGRGYDKKGTTSVRNSLWNPQNNSDEAFKEIKVKRK